MENLVDKFEVIPLTEFNELQYKKIYEGFESEDKEFVNYMIVISNSYLDSAARSAFEYLRSNGRLPNVDGSEYEVFILKNYILDVFKGNPIKALLDKKKAGFSESEKSDENMEIKFVETSLLNELDTDSTNESKEPEMISSFQTVEVTDEERIALEKQVTDLAEELQEDSFTARTVSKEEIASTNFSSEMKEIPVSKEFTNHKIINPTLLEDTAKLFEKQTYELKGFIGDINEELEKTLLTKIGNIKSTEVVVPKMDISEDLKTQMNNLERMLTDLTSQMKSATSASKIREDVILDKIDSIIDKSISEVSIEKAENLLPNELELKHKIVLKMINHIDGPTLANAFKKSVASLYKENPEAADRITVLFTENLGG